MNIIISNASNEPIYQQILNQIKADIMKGELEEGEPLPSIRQLARDLRISVITTKRAYEELEADGFIESVPGKGSFVKAQNRQLVHENQLRLVEEKLLEAIKGSKIINLKLEDLQYMLKLLYEENND